MTGAVRGSSYAFSVLGQGYLLSLQAFGTGLHDKGNARPFLEASIAGRLDRREMDENIFTVFACDEPESFRSIEPLNGSSLFHNFSLLAAKPNESIEGIEKLLAIKGGRTRRVQVDRKEFVRLRIINRNGGFCQIQDWTLRITLPSLPCSSGVARM